MAETFKIAIPTYKDKFNVQSVNGILPDVSGNVNVSVIEVQEDVQKSLTGTLSVTVSNNDTATKTVTKRYNSYSNEGTDNSSSSGGYNSIGTDTFTYGVTFSSTPTVSTSDSGYYRVSSVTTTNARIARYAYRNSNSIGPGYWQYRDTAPAGTATATGQISSSKVVSQTVSQVVNYGVTYKDIPTISNVVGCTVSDIGTTSCTVTTTLSATLSAGQSKELSSDYSFDVIGDVIKGLENLE